MALLCCYVATLFLFVVALSILAQPACCSRFNCSIVYCVFLAVVIETLLLAGLAFAPALA